MKASKALKEDGSVKHSHPKIPTFKTNPSSEKMNPIQQKPLEFSHPFGNVRSVIADVKVNESLAGGGMETRAEILMSSDYYPFGMTIGETHVESEGYRYGYQGSEKDDEVAGEGNSYTTYYRQLDTRLGRWFSIDPARYTGSPYSSMANNPILYNDALGDSIRSYFDTETNSLYVIDLDHYQEGLPTAELSPEMYRPEGLYDMDGNLVQNQILVIEGVFTGGQAEGDGIITYGNDEDQLPIPTGQYEILEYSSSSASHEGWFRIDARDKKPRNDRLDDPTILNKENKMRGNFRLHPGIVSWGCVTCDASNDKALKGFEVLSTILNTTTTEEVKDRLGLMNSVGLRTTMIQKYGTMTVK